MKFTKYFFCGLLALLAVTLTATAAPPDVVNGFAVGSTNRHGTLSYAIVSPRSPVTGAAPVVRYLNAGSDKVAGIVQFYKVTAQCTAAYATNSTTTLSVNRTNGFSSGDVVIIRHLTDDSYEKRILTTMTASTNLITTVAPLGAVVPGDIVYRCTTTGAGTIYWGASTNSINASGAPLYVGQKDTPLLLEIDATTAGAINVVAGDYVR